MPREVTAHLTPDSLRPADLKGATAVIIDVLRASSTICAAVDAGAQQITLVETIDEAREKARTGGLGDGPALLGGERNGVKIDGFQLGNSPSEYTKSAVGGKAIVMTTTNGTRAAARSALADRVLVGCFNNLTALVEELNAAPGPLHLVCAGTDGGIALEDIFCAGAILSLLDEDHWFFRTDAARLAFIAFEDHSMGELDAPTVRSAVAETAHASRLSKLGLGADIAFCGQLDSSSRVPRVLNGVIVPRN